MVVTVMVMVAVTFTASVARRPLGQCRVYI